MSGVPESLNQQLRSLAEQHAQSDLGERAYRQQRRELICQYTGQALPMMTDDAADLATHPGLPAVEVPNQAGSRSLLYWATTSLLIVLALGGLAALFLFMFRH